MLLSLLLASMPLLQGADSPAAVHPGGDLVPPGGNHQTAYDKATKENRRVLVIVGVGDADLQASQEKLLKPRTMQRVLMYEFVEIRQPEPSHPDASHQIAFRIHAADRTPLAEITFSDLRDGEGQLDSTRLLDLLKKHQAGPWDAMELLEEARTQAVAEKKRLFVNLGAPW